MKTMLVILMMMLSGVALAQTSAGELLAFARKFKDKFPSEIKDKSAFEKSYTTRYQGWVYEGDSLIYDDAMGQLQINVGGTGRTTLFFGCTVVGQVAGSTAMGVRGTYKKKVCNELTLMEPHSSPDLITFPATPAIYRSIKDKGFEVETVLKPLMGDGDGAVVKYEYEVARASIGDPNERAIHQYKITGQVLERRFYLVGTKTMIHRILQ